MAAALQWPDRSDGSSAAAYAKTVLDAIKNGQADWRWAPIKTTWKSHVGIFKVLQYPIRIDGFFPGMGARLAQQVADTIGAVFRTAKISDAAYAQAATKIAPVTYGMMGLPTNDDGSPRDMTLVSTMRLYAKMLLENAEKAGYVDGTILGDVGKPWIVDNLLAKTPTKAENYGFYVNAPGGSNFFGLTTNASATDPTISVIQPYSFPPFHDAAQSDSYEGDQADYAEGGSGFMHRTCTVDGKPDDVVRVAQDPELAGLVTVDGQPLTVVRQPNVPLEGCVNPAAARRMTSALGTPVCPTPPVPSNYDDPTGLDPRHAGSKGGSNAGLIVGGVALAAALLFARK